MKFWTLLSWVTQFGFGAVFPVCALLVLGTWLQGRFGLGNWVLLLCGVLGVLISARTVVLSLRELREEVEEMSSQKDSSESYRD